MTANSEARKRIEEAQPMFVLREADRLAVEGKVLAALSRVYFGATWVEASSLRDALEDEGFVLS